MYAFYFQAVLENKLYKISEGQAIKNLLGTSKLFVSKYLDNTQCDI